MLIHCQMHPQELITVNRNQNKTVFVHENVFENVVCKMAVFDWLVSETRRPRTISKAGFPVKFNRKESN